MMLDLMNMDLMIKPAWIFKNCRDVKLTKNPMNWFKKRRHIGVSGTRISFLPKISLQA